MYLFYGLEKYLINNEINEIKKINPHSDLIHYNMDFDSLKQIIEDASMISLFDDKKIIVIENCYFFTGVNNKKIIDNDIKLLEEYIKNPNINTIIIFTVIKEKLDSRKKIVSLIKEKGIVKDFNKPQNINSIVSNELKPYKIDTKTINLFINRVGNNLELLHQEIEKIKTYKNNDMIITTQDIINLTNKNIELDIFKLIDYILLKNKEQAIECYLEMLKQGEEPIALIVMLANQIRIMYQSKELIKKGYSEKDIASLLEIHEFRIKKGLEKARMYQSSDLLYNLERLADLDFEIKTGKIDKNRGLEIFILTI